MADDELSRPPGRRGRDRRAARESVRSGGSRDDDLWYDDPWYDDDTDGSTGVREPRRPLPLGPMSGAGERPMPQPPQLVSLSDPRR